MYESLVSLRGLRVFISVAVTGSIQKSADNLFRAPSAVTRSVRDLELFLGVQLFERKSRGMLLTTFGEVLLLRARRVEQELLLSLQELDLPKAPRSTDNAAIFSILFNEKRLQIFVDLSENHHMPTAAKEHGISQPAISLSIRELESSLGQRLFERSAKGLIPTDKGIIFAFRIKRALAELRVIQPELAAIQGSIEGTITVGALPFSRTTILPASIARLIEKHPRLRIKTIESPYEALATGLRNGDIDFILGALRPVDFTKDLMSEAFLSDVVSIVVRTDHPLTKKAKVTVEDLLASQWILSRTGSPARELIKRSFDHMGYVTPTPVVETGDLAILRGLLLQSNMITAISGHQLQYEIDIGSLVELDFSLEETMRDIGITQRIGAKLSPGANSLIEEIKALVKELTLARG
jgi:LysR family transcriptional regulator of gallate degradation